MAKKIYIWGIIIIVAVAAMFIFLSDSGKSYEAIEKFEGEVKIYKSDSCGCCGVYGSYFKREGNPNVEIVDLEDINQEIKQQYGIPSELGSCHTTIIGEYFVEGHMPLEAIEKLLKEKPNIAGIALPGMPEGSPGMVGNKRGDFVIYAVNNDGTYQEFMRL